MRKTTIGFLSLAVVMMFAAPALAQVGFSSSVAVGDGEVFIGEPGTPVPSGLVYVYRSAAGDWREVAALTASDAAEADGFGTAMALAGDELLISAVTADRGVVYVFRREARTWTEVSTLVAADGATTERFGSALALDGDVLVVGAAGADEGHGAAYVFERRGSGWRQVARLIGDRPAEGEQEEEPQRQQGRRRGPPLSFGASLAVSGDWAFIGAPAIDRGAGAVYAFHRQGGAWQRAGRFPEEAGATGSAMGAAIAFHSGEVLIGATGANGGVGTVHILSYDEESEQWGPRLSLMPFDGDTGALFGSSIVASGPEVFIGAPGAGGGGSIYHFSRDSAGNFASAAKVGPTGLSRRAQFAGTLALDGDVMVAGLPGDDYGAGTAMIMTRGFSGWDRTKVLSEAKGFAAMGGEVIECAGGMIDRYPCENVDVLSFVPLREMGGNRGALTNDIWGWTDPETGKDYALVCFTDLASFVDVTDPLNPIFVGTLPMHEGAQGSTWRDIKVRADHAYIVSDGAGPHGVQVFDLTRLREFDGEPIEFTEDAHYDLINSAHNIVINEASAFAFVVGASGGGETCGGGLHMINIEDPTRPAFAGCFADVSTGRRGTGYSHDAQCVIYNGPDERYRGREICFGSNETALSVADVTDKRNPVAIGMATYPNVAYTHQGWLTEDHSYFYMNDEGDEPRGLVAGTRTLVWDVRELDDPVLAGEYINDTPDTDHNLYVVDDLMYQSNYGAGLRVFDVSDPAEIDEIGYFDTDPEGATGGTSWGNYPFFESRIVVFTSGRVGLFVAKFRDPR